MAKYILMFLSIVGSSYIYPQMQNKGYTESRVVVLEGIQTLFSQQSRNISYKTGEIFSFIETFNRYDSGFEEKMRIDEKEYTQRNRLDPSVYQEKVSLMLEDRLLSISHFSGIDTALNSSISLTEEQLAILHEGCESIEVQFPRNNLLKYLEQMGEEADLGYEHSPSYDPHYFYHHKFSADEISLVVSLYDGSLVVHSRKVKKLEMNVTRTKR